MRNAQEWRHAFLAELATSGVLKDACKAVEVNYGHMMRLRVVDPTFEADLLDAMEQATDDLESEARRRAVKGVQRGVYHLGEVVGSQTEYSDSLLTLLLKGRRKEVFGTQRTEIGGLNGGALQSEITVISGVPGPADGLI